MAAGEVHYNTGKPCINGHLSDRQTSNGGCLECINERSRIPANIAKRRLSTNARYQVSKVEKLKYGKEYRERNREKFTQYMANWRAANPDRNKANKRASESKRRAGMKGVSNKEFIDWTSAQPKICHWCGKRCEDGFHVDHYEPIAKGGKHEISNFVIACQFCNLSKKCKDPYQFAASMGRLF